MKYFRYDAPIDKGGKAYGINTVFYRDFAIAVSIWLILGLLALVSNFTPLVWIVEAYMVCIAVMLVLVLWAKLG